MQRLIKVLATFFYLGFFPVASGTFASLSACVIYLLVYRSQPLYIVCAVSLSIVGFCVAGRAESIFGKKDPRQIVIDEAAGLLWAFIFLPPKFWVLFCAFILYRIFDIVKVPPARQLERLPGSLGIMLDDFISAIYANLIMQLVIRII